MFKRICTAALVFGVLAMAPPTQATAQVACGYRDAITTVLSERYGETQMALGVQNAGSIVEVWTSKDTGTWTILMTRPNGTSCLMASGEGWQRNSQAAPVVGQSS